MNCQAGRTVHLEPFPEFHHDRTRNLEPFAPLIQNVDIRRSHLFRFKVVHFNVACLRDTVSFPDTESSTKHLV